jgi:hypothetical protein
LRKKTLAYALLCLLLISLVAMQLVEVARANPEYAWPPPNSIFIRSNGNVVGTDKIMQNGNTYSLTDHIYLSNKFLVVEKDNIILDGSGFNLTGDGNFISGIYILGRINITIQNFIITNFYIGIYPIDNNRQIRIFNNTLIRNYYGIMPGYDFENLGNSVFCNNFIDNNHQIGSSSGFNWDNDSLGNFWSNYNGTDANGDGIGDAPFYVSSKDVDNFPLMAPVILPLIKPTPTPTPASTPSPTLSASLSPALTETPSPSPTIPEFPLTALTTSFLAVTVLVGVFFRRKQLRDN